VTSEPGKALLARLKKLPLEKAVAQLAKLPLAEQLALMKLCDCDECAHVLSHVEWIAAERAAGRDAMVVPRTNMTFVGRDSTAIH
jgi:hypothetical protein